MDKYGFYLLFVLALFGLTSANQIDEICKDKPIELKTVGDIRPLIKAIKAGKGNVCSVEVARMIGHYYALYIKRGRLHLPSSLPDPIKNYFLALSAEISGYCENALVHNLKEASNRRISEEEASELQNFNKHINQLSAVIGGTELRIEDLAIVIDLSGLVSKKSAAPSLVTKQTLAVNRKTKEQVDRIKSLCRNKFKPVYDKLITPLAILTNLGFAHTPGYLKGAKQTFKKEPIYQQWFSAVLICESTLGLKVVEAPDGEDNNVATILGEQDLQAKLDQRPEEDPAIQAAVPEEYKPYVRMMDYIYINHFDLSTLAEQVNEKRKEAKELRNQVAERLLNHLKGLTESDSLKVGPNISIEKPKRNASSTISNALTGIAVKPKYHWKRATLFILGIGLSFFGFFTSNPIAIYLGIALVAAMIVATDGQPMAISRW